MCELVEKYGAECRAEGRAEGKEVKAIEIALNLIAGAVLNDEQIAAATGLSVDEIRDLRLQKK